MDDFHFLRPGWLFALPAGLALVWAYARRLRSGERWREVCDAALLPHLLAHRDGAFLPLPPVLMGGGLILAVLALAGPAWHAEEQTVHRVKQARIVVLDLSRSMDAPDLPPSRLSRARLKTAELFAQTEEGQTGLVVYAGDAFLVSPLTDDSATLSALLPALTTDLMPAKGSRADLGLRRAGVLLEQAGLRHGELILIADSAEDFRAVEVAAELKRSGFRTSVLAAGTARGAPIPLAGGGFLADGAGNIVVPRLDVKGLREVARAGGGRFVTMTSDDRDLARLLARDARGRGRFDTEASEREVLHWRDEGPWLVLALLPIAALAFRRGWLLGVACLLFVPGGPARAFDWQDLWTRPDEQAAQALARGDPAAALRKAEDARWRAPALYRNREFAAAAAAYAGLPGAKAHYNRGNALARSGRLRDALDAYDTALALAPGLEDAAFNRTLVEELLREREAAGREAQDRAGQGRGQRAEDAPPEGSRPDERPPGNGDPRGEPGGHGRQEAGGEGSQRSAGAEGSAREARASDATPPAGTHAGQAGGVDPPRPTASPAEAGGLSDEQRQALEQWLRRIPDDPGGLLRRKFALDHQRRGHPDPDSPRTW